MAEKRAKEQRQADASLAPYAMMSHAIHIAGGKEKFDRERFKVVLKEKFLGADFEYCKANAHSAVQTKLVKAEKKFDQELDKMAQEMDKGIKKETFDKPQKNGLIKKCCRGVMNSFAAIVAIVPPVLATNLTTKGAENAAAIAANLGITSLLTSVGATVGGGLTAGLAITAAGGGTLLGGCVYAMSRYADSTNKSSKPEELMDRLVDVVDQHFVSEMKKISGAQVSQKPTKVQKSAQSFQERFSKTRSSVKTFEGREVEKQREEKRRNKSHSRD